MPNAQGPLQQMGVPPGAPPTAPPPGQFHPPVPGLYLILQS